MFAVHQYWELKAQDVMLAKHTLFSSLQHLALQCLSKEFHFERALFATHTHI
jgi:hypothetical protein